MAVDEERIRAIGLSRNLVTLTGIHRKLLAVQRDLDKIEVEHNLNTAVKLLGDKIKLELHGFLVDTEILEKGAPLPDEVWERFSEAHLRR